MKSWHPQIRAMLRANDDGMTSVEICTVLGASDTTIRKALNDMPDAYIDRWAPATRGQHSAVWCVVVPPPHCPRPSKARDA